ncbi:Nucleotide-binding universal stress protein, UspA family [Candidatus Nitrotoga sp. BS]|uniref:universal stress protein n=1 Tax=Candidatus Nitrotoga sp. BS TaxID=2890408 RepID=UPI001EF1B458|nr:universal stress protein [Candidatus Nitrotoga sp. BS]CAH1209681.1 Nucleotide-binding universal stress protein, UspA family [Candidatus Nitrotoga sp. BS]
MKIEKKILACVDQSHFADYVADYAAWAAQRMNAPLEFLHVIDRHPEIATGNDHSGAIGFDAQEHLLTELSKEEGLRSKAAREQGRLFLNRLRDRAISAGVESPDVRQRYGNLVETMTEQEDDVRLFVLGRRGQSAEITQRDLGRNVERVVRGLHKPILTITEDYTEPRRVMIAFDGGIVTRRGVEMVAASPLFKGLPVHLLMSGKESQDAEKQLEWARKTLESTGFDAQTSLIPGDAERIIAKTVSEQNIDILIMGAYSHSPLRSLLLGSKTSDMLRSAKIPTLLLR